MSRTRTTEWKTEYRLVLFNLTKLGPSASTLDKLRRVLGDRNGKEEELKQKDFTKKKKKKRKLAPKRKQ